MARKNLIGVSDTQLEDTSAGASHSRPLAGLSPLARPNAPVGGITKTLGNITQKMERAQDLERQLAEGQRIVEIDPSLIEGSFVKDRLSFDRDALTTLVDQIREHGQQVPILVRPHQSVPGHYQVAYGHRRLAAARELGIKVRAVVRTLSDDDLVISQGQENNARTNLSYIERALFALQLEERGFRRETLIAALGVDKAALSKMISTAKGVPGDWIMAIGPAPNVGRRRWMELIELATPEKFDAVSTKLSAVNFQKADSDERFRIVFSELRNWKVAQTNREKPESIDQLPVTIRVTASKTSFAFDTKKAPGFDNFVRERLSSLFAEFNKQSGDH